MLVELAENSITRQSCQHEICYPIADLYPASVLINYGIRLS